MRIANLALNPIAWEGLGLKVHWYGVIIACAMLLAVTLSVQEGKKRGVDSDVFYDLLLLGLPVALVCARTYYVVFEWGYYAKYPWMIYRIWDGGIAIYGGLIGAALTVLIYAKRKFLSPLLLCDIMAPTVILAQGIGRWGNFMNQEAHGLPTTRAFLESLHLPTFIINQMDINGVYYQPTFLYESSWDILGGLLLLALRHRPNLFKRGEVFFAYVIWYGCGRFVIEGMRTDSLMLGPLRVSQWLSVVFIIAAVTVLVYNRVHAKTGWYLDAKPSTDPA